MALHNQELGERIARARHERGWKQKQLAAALGVETTAVSRWERGTNDPPLDKLVEIARVLRVHVSYLVKHLDGPAPPPDGSRTGGVDEPALSRLEQRVEELAETVKQALQERSTGG